MQLGICGSIEIASIAHGAGFDYVEVNVVRDLRPTDPEDAVEAGLATAPLPAPVANVFLPGTHRLTGDDVDERLLEHYVRTAFARARAAGIEIIVFGSGGARRIPDGFDPGRAWAQLVRFGRMIGPIAVEHGVTVAVEPLRYAECNVLNTVAESAQYVRDVAHPGVRLLVDAYHWAQNDEPVQSILDAGPLLVHAHIATYENRLAPGQEPCDFGPFFDALAESRYAGRLSVEARWEIDLDSAQSARAVLGRFLDG